MSQFNIPNRQDVPLLDQWDLTHLFQHESDWESAYTTSEKQVELFDSFKGTLHQSKEQLLKLLHLLTQEGILLERIMQYAFLQQTSDGGSSTYQHRYGKAQQLITLFSSKTSFIEPEIMAIDEPTLQSWLALAEFDDYRVMIQKMLRFKAHTLDQEQEKIMALQQEVGSKASEAFGALTNVDLQFGTITTDEGKVPLTQSTFGSLLQHPSRSVRRRTYNKFYKVFDQHKHVLTQLYDAAVKQSMFRSRVRSYPSTLEMALFPDNVDKNVYENLIQTVHNHISLLHRYYEIRKRALGLKKLAHYDVYVPLVKDVKVTHTYEEAVELIKEAMAPLGQEYVDTITRGLTTDRWVDRYENKGKRSGAFSSGTFSGPPYILMNYKEDVLRDVFTLAHEGGHSMHSYYSAKSNPYSSYDYTIFEAEVASTFNEQLLAHHMIQKADSKELEAYIVGKQIDDIVATLFRQTMFAEFEMIVHHSAEQGEPITVDSLTSKYRSLLEFYFGKDVQLFDVSALEALRIPHFYRPFYVYKYATGLSAAIALAEGVLQHKEGAKERYLSFLHSGGSHYPIDALKKAGVDMSSATPIEDAMDFFNELLDRYEQLIV
ncbi:MAG: oligoendopeptidase F [Sphaerochaetaceae bacterium]|jgi:oligoendopeptidase F